MFGTLLDSASLRNAAKLAAAAAAAPGAAAPSSSSLPGGDGIQPDELPVIFTTFEKYTQEAAKRPGNKPFILPLRFVPESLEAEHQLRVAGGGRELLSSKEEEGKGKQAALVLEKVAEVAQYLQEHVALPAAMGGDAAAAGTSKGGKSKGKGKSMARSSTASPPPPPAASSGKRGGTAGASSGRGGGGGGGAKTPSEAPQPIQDAPLQERDPTDKPARCVGLIFILSCTAGTCALHHPPIFVTMCRYVDMLLVLLNFPTSMGEVSKPNGGKGPQQGDWANTEPFVFPFWCVGPERGARESSHSSLFHPGARLFVTPLRPDFIPLVIWCGAQVRVADTDDLRSNHARPICASRRG